MPLHFIKARDWPVEGGIINAHHTFGRLNTWFLAAGAAFRGGRTVGCLGIAGGSSFLEPGGTGLEA